MWEKGSSPWSENPRKAAERREDHVRGLGAHRRSLAEKKQGSSLLKVASARSLNCTRGEGAACSVKQPRTGNGRAFQRKKKLMGEKNTEKKKKTAEEKKKKPETKQYRGFHSQSHPRAEGGTNWGKKKAGRERGGGELSAKRPEKTNQNRHHARRGGREGIGNREKRNGTQNQGRGRHHNRKRSVGRGTSQNKRKSMKKSTVQQRKKTQKGPIVPRATKLGTRIRANEKGREKKYAKLRQ